MDRLHLVLLALLLIALALAMLRLRSLLAVAILSGVYSLVLAALYTFLDAVDVTFTEAAVGAGITLTLMLAAISLTTTREAPLRKDDGERLLGLIASLTAGLGLLYATLEMPGLGDPDAPIQQHVGNRFIAEAPDATGVPNMVTSILASYRSYDTLGEVTVIFTAGISVIALLWRWRRDET